MTSGTQGNLVALMGHLARGQEAIAGRQHHLVIDEAAGHAVIVGASIRQLPELPDGTLDPDAVDEAFRDPTDVHEPPSGLVTLENTHAHSMGQPLDAEYMTRIATIAHDHGVPLHVDGARFFNAVVALGTTPARAGRAGGLGHVLPEQRAGLSGRLAGRRLGGVRRSGAPGAQARGRRDAPGRRPRRPRAGRPARRPGRDDRAPGRRPRQRRPPGRGPRRAARDRRRR